MEKGLIIRSTGLWYEVLGQESQKIYKGRLRGKLKLKESKLTNPIAVGDYVEIEVESEKEGTVLINEVFERENYIIRQSTHKTAHAHILAANIDQAFLMATITMPKTSLGFIDRFLVSAESSHIPTIIVFNKTDLLDKEHLEYIEMLKQLYESLGYPCYKISALQKETLSELNELIKGKKTLISGHSGVGKSTLLNQLAPHAQQKTSAVSTFANKGVHTTTFAEMFDLGENTFLIDTPGIKELGIIGLGEQELTFYFPEMKELQGKCRYYNCTHRHEPLCAVIQAVEEGKIAITRYESYVSIFEAHDNRK
ncbi:MAG: ribosome small subunit-dependent GTPase A [Flammeovirgaceae bacterium]